MNEKRIEKIMDKILGLSFDNLKKYLQKLDKGATNRFLKSKLLKKIYYIKTGERISWPYFMKKDLVLDKHIFPFDKSNKSFKDFDMKVKEIIATSHFLEQLENRTKIKNFNLDLISKIDLEQKVTEDIYGVFHLLLVETSGTYIIRAKRDDVIKDKLILLTIMRKPNYHYVLKKLGEKW